MKDLPWFKFIISEWANGDITLCSFEAQGLFINLCSLYWSKGGNVRMTDAKHRYNGCSTAAWKELVSRKIIKVSGEVIKINFLDEQFNDRKNLSEIKRLNALGKHKPEASAKHPQDGRKASAHNKEERRGEENKIDEKFNSKIASLIHKPYSSGKTRGMDGAGQDVDLLVRQLQSIGYDQKKIEDQIRSMRSYYRIQKLTFPQAYITLLNSLTENDFVAKLKDLDSETTQHGKQREPEPDTIGTSAPGSLG